MPRRELKFPRQVDDWLIEMGSQIHEPSQLILIGSGGLPWHAHQRGISDPLPENSMDVDPITDSDQVARLCYEALIGSEFEATHGWHVNLMPDSVLRELPAGMGNPRIRKVVRYSESDCPGATRFARAETATQRTTRSRTC